MWIAVATALTLLDVIAGQTYDLKLSGAEGAKQQVVVSSEIADVLLSGTSMGITGTFRGVFETAVLKVDGEKKTLRLQVAGKDFKVTLNDAEQTPPAIEPIIFEVDERGRVQQIEGIGNLAALDMSAAAGMPIAVLAGVACLPRLPQGPVAVGDTWELEDQQATPFGVVATAKSKMKLVEVKDGAAVLQGDVEASCPDFEAPNPMQPGMTMNVKNATLQVIRLSQVVDMQTGFVREASGRFRMSLTADMQGFELPMVAYIDFATAGSQEEADKKLATLSRELGMPGQEKQEEKPAGTQQTAKREAGPGAEQPGLIREVREEDFADQVLKALRPVLVYFWAQWCDPCKRQKPILEEIAKAYRDVLSVVGVNADEAEKLVRRLAVEVLPTLILFTQGKESWRAVGLRMRDEIAAAIDRVLGKTQCQSR